jgi:hypothetical protein
VVRKKIKLTFKILAGLLLIGLITLALILWRLSSHPLQLNTFIPEIEQQLADLPGGFSARLKGLDLFWNRKEYGLELKLVDVDLMGPAGTRVVNAPEIDVSLSVRALMSGVVALSSVELNDLKVTLVRGDDRTFRFFSQATDKSPEVVPNPGQHPSSDVTSTVQHFVGVLRSDPDPDYPLSYLKQFRIAGEVDIEDHVSGLSWSMHVNEATFVGVDGEIQGDLSLGFSAPQAVAGVALDLGISTNHSVIDTSLEFSGLQPASLASLDDRLGQLSSLSAAVSGTISSSLTLPDEIHSLTARVKTGAGQYSNPNFYPTPLKFNSTDLQMDADPAGKSAKISSLDISLGKSTSPLTLHLSGGGDLGDGSVSVQFKALLQNLEVTEMDLYWPQGVALGARNWLVDNLVAGEVSQASLDMAMVLPLGPESQFQLKELKGDVSFNGLTVDYYGSLPVATGVDGSGSYDRHGFDLNVNNGRVHGASIDSGKVLITGLDNKKAAIAVNTQLSGELADIYAVLEAPLLNLDQVTGFTSSQLSGKVVSSFGIELPLRASLEKEDIRYKADGRITGGALQNLFRGRGVQNAKIDIHLTQSGLKMSGPLEFGGAPLTIDWSTHLTGAEKGRSDFVVDNPQLTAAAITPLNEDLSKYLQGEFAFNAKGNIGPGKNLKVSVQSDLTDAELSVPRIMWAKPVGEAASLGFTLLRDQDGPIHGQDVKIRLGTLKSSGQVDLDLSEPRLSLERLDVVNGWFENMVLKQSGPGIVEVTVQGGELNVEPFLAADDQQEAVDRQLEAETKAISKEIKSAGMTLIIGDSKLDKIHTNDSTHFDNVRFSARMDRSGLHEIKLSGFNPIHVSTDRTGVEPGETQSLNRGQFSATFGPLAAGQYPLQIDIEDLGAMISALKGKTIMEHGHLVLNGTSEAPLLNEAIQATFEIDYFTLKKAPAFSQILNMASLSQIVSTFSNQGLAFNSWSGDLKLEGSRLSTKQMLMNGGSLGVEVGGWTDLKQGTVDLKGVVVPMQKLGKVIGKIPVLGQVVAGTDGKGLIVFDYTVK